MSPPDVCDCRNRDAGHTPAAAEMVSGGLPDGDAFQQHLGPSTPAQARRHVQDRLARSPQAPAAMVDPIRTPLSGTVDADETSMPFRRKEDAAKRGGGSSKANQMWIAGAVETRGRFGVGRIRLARIADRSAASLVPFITANTAPGTYLRTDKYAAYEQVPDRWLTQVNLSKNDLPAHHYFKWIHLVFSNLKRWALGTFHGFREKHIDAYLNEFVFRWNRRRHFRSAMNTMLGISRRVGRLTYRDIVGDTRQWKKEHINAIMKMLHPNKRQIVKDLVRYYRVSRLEVMENLVRWVDRLKEEDPKAFLEYRWGFRASGNSTTRSPTPAEAGEARPGSAAAGRGAPDGAAVFQSRCLETAHTFWIWTTPPSCRAGCGIGQTRSVISISATNDRSCSRLRVAMAQSRVLELGEYPCRSNLPRRSTGLG